jgi:glutamate dehydrogenase (NAD(P)+)
VMDTFSMHAGTTTTAIVTGKPLELGGSAGRREATGRGVSIVAREAARHAGFALSGARVAVQGFGNVGSVSAQLLRRMGARVVAVTDWKGGVYDERGLDVDAMIEHARQFQTVDGFPAGKPLSNEDLFRLDVDILVPAALENQITAKNVADVRARIVIEGANGPTTPEAHRALHERGVFVVPDILANAGGVTASYFEWVQNRHGYFWPEDEVNERLEAKMMAAFETVVKTARRYRVDLRTAAYAVAIDRVATVTRMRGMYA